MQFRARILLACALAIALGSACDASNPTERANPLDPPGRGGDEGKLDTIDGDAGRFDGIRARAEAAFQDPSIEPERFETRIGPQPWPEDLPSSWPRPAIGRVVADSKRAGGERLLLVDVPGSADEALAAYRRALRDEDFEVDDAASGESRRGLRARHGLDEARLRFFDRDRRARVEILFLARSDS